VKQDDAARLLEITDGAQSASVKAAPLSGSRTEIVVVADVPKGDRSREKEQELAL
jgi:hypothetical protein